MAGLYVITLVIISKTREANQDSLGYLCPMESFTTPFTELWAALMCFLCIHFVLRIVMGLSVLLWPAMRGSDFFLPLIERVV